MCEALVKSAVSFLLVLFFTWLIFHQNEAKITITDAHLTQFNFTTTTNNTTLNYNLSFNLTLRNPNKRIGIGIGYRRIRVIGKYRKKKFGMVTLPNTTVPFHQGHKNTTFLRDILLQGQQVVKFGKKEFSQYDKETAARVYTIDAVLAIRVKIKFGRTRFPSYSADAIHCKLRLPLTTPNQTSTTIFIPSKCKNVAIVNGWIDLATSWIK